MSLPTSPRVSPMTISAHLRYPVVKRALASVPDATTVTEFGSGRGAMAKRFVVAGFDYMGYEPDPESFAVASAVLGGSSAAVLHNDFPPEHPTRPSDIVVAFEVLEHIEDDEAALRAWCEWLNPGGLLLISIPAHRDRFGPADVAAGHYRRYERDELLALFERVGLVDAQVRSVGFPAGYLLQMVRDRVLGGEDLSVEERTASSGRLLQPTSRTALLTAAAAFPFHPVQRVFERTDLGTGYVAWARRPADR